MKELENINHKQFYNSAAKEEAEAENELLETQSIKYMTMDIIKSSWNNLHQYPVNRIDPHALKKKYVLD